MKKQEIKEHPDITFLKNQELSQLLSDAFAKIYLTQPKFPVTYLANYLLSYSKTKKQQSKIQAVIQNKKNIVRDSKIKLQQVNRKNQQLRNAQNKILKQNQKFKLQIKNNQSHFKLLQQFCDYLQTNYNLTGVYIGQQKYPKRIIKVNQESQTAHLQTDQPKRIQYIASSTSHQNIMKQKYLNLDSITGAVFQQKKNDDDDNQSKPKDEVKGYIYIPQVIKNDKLVYFRYPKLGAYMCVPMIVKSYLNESLFEAGLEQTIKYNKNVQQLQKQREKKDNQFRQLYQQKSKSGADQKELDDLQRKFQQQKSTIPDVPHPILPSVSLYYVVCFDTLGKQIQISEQKQSQLFEYVNYFKQCWQNKQLSYLKSDIDIQIKYLQNFDIGISDYLVKINEQQQKQLIGQIQEISKLKLAQKQQNFQIQSLRLEKIKEHLTDQKYLSYYNILLSMNTIRFPGILQSVLYFLGYQKKNINFPDTNILNWRQAKNIFKINKILQKLIEYNHRGLKTKTPLPYAKWNKLLMNLQKYDLNSVLGYNLTLGKILKYMIMTGRLRKIDIQLRRQKLQNLRKLRQQKKLQNEKIIAQRQRVKQQVKKAAEQKQGGVFDEETWQIQYNQEHPLLQIGEQIKQQIDRDFDFEESL